MNLRTFSARRSAQRGCSFVLGVSDFPAEKTDVMYLHCNTESRGSPSSSAVG